MGTIFQQRLDATANITLEGSATATTVVPVHKSTLQSVLADSGPLATSWAGVTRFKSKSGEVLVVPDTQGAVGRVLLGVDGPSDLWGFAALPSKLPPGAYRISLTDVEGGRVAPDVAALGWLLGQYTFERYKQKKKDGEEAPAKPVLVWPEGADSAGVQSLYHSIAWCRDMITTPAEDMGPQHMAEEATALADYHNACLTLISGPDLMRHNYPAVHAVGRASVRPPVLIDIRWTPPDTQDPAALPVLALVGKGVCFDTGGLDLKTVAGMKLMKKDMGGGALVLALAHLVMSHRLPVRLRVLLPAVENSVSGNAFRPLDVLNTRAGMTVEVGNTDAEGRLILADALFEAAGESPDLLMDVATLTGARNVALGNALPGAFCNEEALWGQLAAACEKEDDLLWRLPLHKPYRKALDSNVADIHSTGSMEGSGAAILAALFLQEFIQGVPRWLHVDTPAYNSGTSPGKPEGGEATGLRALWRLLRDRYPTKPPVGAV